MKYLIIYLVIINFIAFLAYRSDKKKAEKGKWRIKESTLLALSFLGGGVGSMFAMSKYRHKTQKNKFKFGVPILTIISIIIIWFFIKTLGL